MPRFRATGQDEAWPEALAVTAPIGIGVLPAVHDGPGVLCLRAQLLLDVQKLIVLGHAKKPLKGLLRQRLFQCHGHGHGCADHGVVAHAQEAHHLHVRGHGG